MFLRGFEHLLPGPSYTPEQQREMDRKIIQKTAEAQAAIDRRLGAAQVDPAPKPPLTLVVRHSRKAASR